MVTKPSLPKTCKDLPSNQPATFQHRVTPNLTTYEGKVCGTSSSCLKLEAVKATPNTPNECGPQ